MFIYGPSKCYIQHKQGTSRVQVPQSDDAINVQMWIEALGWGGERLDLGENNFSMRSGPKDNLVDSCNRYMDGSRV